MQILKLCLAIAYFFVALLASQILHGQSISVQSIIGNSSPQFWQKIIAALIVLAPIFLAFYYGLIWGRGEDEYQRKINDRAIANAAASGVLVILAIQIFHDLFNSILPPNIEIIPSICLVWYFIAKMNLLKSKLDA